MKTPHADVLLLLTGMNLGTTRDERCLKIVLYLEGTWKNDNEAGRCFARNGRR